MAYALYPDVFERHFSLQADLALLNNQAAAQASSRPTCPRSTAWTTTWPTRAVRWSA